VNIPLVVIIRKRSGVGFTIVDGTERAVYACIHDVSED
jgi:hypothetical protein